MKTYLPSIFAGNTRNNNKRTKTHKPWFWTLLVAYLLCLSFSSPSYSHRGSADEIDNCRIKVGYEKIHLTVYTPKFTRSQGFCQFIPNIGVTNMVFDYEGKKLRNITIEFEVTKEPEGTRVFYQQPQKIKTGTMNASMDFSKFGASKYLVHVTIVHKGEKLDTHLPIYVGVEETKTHWGLYLFLLLVVLLVVFFVKLARANPVGKN